MKHVHYSDVEAKIPKEDGVKDVVVRWLIAKEDGAKNFAMRLFEVKSGGFTPLHQHDWEHEVFIVNGSGELRDKTQQYSFKKGDVVFVQSMQWHQFVNTGDEELRFLCVIPI